MKKIIKEPIFWVVIILVISITSINLFTDINLVNSFHNFVNNFKFPPIEAFIAVFVWMIIIGLALHIVISKDKHKNGKFREELKVGDIVHYDKHPNCEVLEVGENHLCVKIRIPKHIVSKPKK